MCIDGILMHEAKPLGHFAWRAVCMGLALNNWRQKAYAATRAYNALTPAQRAPGEAVERHLREHGRLPE